MGMSYEEKIALSRKIMVAGIVSLLAATILIIFLHFYAKYLLMRQERAARHRRSHRSQVLVAPVDGQIGSTDSSRSARAGLDALIIASLPKFVYNTRAKDCEEAVECTVCLSGVCGEDMVRMLPNCRHLFHLECIDEWLDLHTTCPICRAPAEPRSEIATGRVEAGSGSAAVESQIGSSSLMSSFRKLVSGERSSGRVQSCDVFRLNDIESQ